MNASKKIFWMLIVLSLIQMAWFYPKLPSMMASHFNAAGKPDGWSTKGSFLLVHIVTVLVVCVPFGFFHQLFKKLPNRWFSLPNRDYWLAPERREETINALARQLLWFGNATMAFLFIVFHLVYRGNLGAGTELGSQFWAAFVLYLIFVGIWTIFFIRGYWKKPNSG